MFPLFGCGQKNSDPENYKETDSLAEYVTIEKAQAAVAEMRNNNITKDRVIKRSGYSYYDHVDIADGYSYYTVQSDDPIIMKVLYIRESESSSKLYAINEAPNSSKKIYENDKADSIHQGTVDNVRNTAEGILLDSDAMISTYMEVDFDSFKYYVGKTTLKVTGKGTNSGEDFTLILEKETFFPKSAVINYLYGPVDNKVKTKETYTFDCDADFHHYTPEEIGFYDE